MKKQIAKICKNCKLYNPAKNHCSVVILHEGERIHIPVDSIDPCFFEGEYFDPTSKAMESFIEDVKEVRFWVEDEQGEKTAGDGVVKIEYPDNFFGKEES